MPLPAVHLARDHTVPYVRARLRDQTWVRVRPGAYADRAADEGRGADAERGAQLRRLALARVVAVAHQSTAPVTISHTSAALVWGLPLVGDGSQVHVTQPSRPGKTYESSVTRHHGPLEEPDVVTHRGLPVTALERTVVDCLRLLPPKSGLILADAALHLGVDPEACGAMLRTMTGRRGVARARQILCLADPGSESPGESVLRFRLLQLGLPIPSTQVHVPTRIGSTWSDLGWEEWRILCEYDGRVKYETARADRGGAGVEALVREKRRQEAIEDEGWRVTRFSSEDVRTLPGLRGRLRRTLPPEAWSAPIRRPILGTS